MKKLIVCLLFLCGCRAAVVVDPLVGLPAPLVATPLPPLQIVDQPKYLPSVTLGRPVAIEPEPQYLPKYLPELPPLPRPELPPLPPLPDF